jgi:hypothetical protein
MLRLSVFFGLDREVDYQANRDRYPSRIDEGDKADSMISGASCMPDHGYHTDHGMTVV